MDPLWSKAPRVLTRFPGLALAVAAGAMILTLTAVAFPLFVSASENELLADGIAKGTVTRYGAGITYVGSNVDFDDETADGELLREARNRLFDREIAKIPQLDEPLRSILGPAITLAPVGDDSVERVRFGRLFFRDHQLEHVGIVEGSEGPGVWISDYTAEGMRVGAGDTISVSFQGSRPVKITIDGIYGAIFRESPTGFWRPWRQDIYCSPEGPGACTPPPPFVFTDHDQLLQLSSDLGKTSATFGWDAPLAAGFEPTTPEMRELEASYLRIQERMSTPGNQLYDVFRCCGPGFFSRSIYRTSLSSSTPQVLVQVEQRAASTEVPIRLLLITALLLAVTVVAGTGAYSLATRAAETELLYARGMSPGTMAVKAGIECLVPGLVGCGAGALLAYGLVRSFGPDGAISEAAARQAQIAGLGAAIAALFVIAVVTATVFARRSTAHKRSWFSRVPWDLAAVLVALYALTRLIQDGALTGDADSAVARPTIFLLLFPLLVLGGLSGLTARMFRTVFARWSRRDRKLSDPTYLMVNRIAGAPALAVLLFAASAASLGIFVHARTVVSSLERTVDAKVRLFVGSDVAGTVGPLLDTPDEFPYPITKVFRVIHAGRLEDGPEIDIVAIDPETLPSVAYWDPAFGAASVQDAIEPLEGNGEGSVRAIAVGKGSLPERFEVDVAAVPFDFQVENTLRAFPGMVSERPTIVVDQAAFTEVVTERGSGLLNSSDVTAEWWVRGDTEGATEALLSVEDPPAQILTAEEVSDIPSIDGVIDTFRVLNLVGLGAAILVVVATLMYQQARRRARLLSYGLSRRMGLSHRAHGTAVIFELTTLLLASYVAGAVVAIAVSRFIASMIDPLAAIPPDTLFSLPTAALGTAAAALLVVAIVAGVLSNRSASRTDLGSLIRASE